MRTYAASEVKTTFGSHSVTGTNDGDFVNIEPLTDGVTSQAGADGEVARSMSADRRCRVTITVQQTSSSNDFFSAAYLADQTSGGRAPLPLTIRDLRGNTVFAAAKAWVTKLANAGFGKTAGSREWVLETDRADYFVGGNE
jgi:hypothetical protein